MICPACSTENIPGAKFCNECGTPLAAPCPTCGAINQPGAKFCNECGTQLLAPAVAAAGASDTTTAAQPVAERRLVTVLFADIVGFTPFAEERDAEDVRETLSRYFELCAQVVERYGGTVEKYIGDAVMAVWGAPTAHEDDAERAVRAALDLVDSVSALGPEMQARAGVLTGEAAVTLGATNQGMVAGDLVNTASRIQSVAPAGSVLVGEQTYRAAGNAIAFEHAGDQMLKGKEAPVPTWRATRVIAERGGRNRTEGLEAPFVGRADELRLLKDLFHATGREQKARLVSVIGPAGIGKSRLAWEFLKYVDGLVETTYWHNGRSPAYGEGISFWALGEMVRGRCGLLETDDEPTTRQKVADTVAQWVTDTEEREWIERALLALLGIEAGLSPDALFGAWRTFFERISEHGTVTLVFEDMHFADSGLLDFIDHLLEWSRGRPIYIVTLARPELLERRQDWGAGKRSFTSIYLEPLSETDMRELLAGLVPGLPESAAAAIVARADGIPLYAVETVRTLVADGKLVERDGAYTPVGDLTTLTVPETLTALITSRLDALDADDRNLVHDAAVIGQSFSVEALAAVSNKDTPDLIERLRGLVRRELLQQEIDPRSPERGRYEFVQALIREVAYNTLAKRDRKTRHLAAARYFEQLGSDELAGALAGHYLAAHANATQPAEADALATQARIALKAAADRAAALGSFDLAVSFLEQAITISTERSDVADLHERAGEESMHGGHFDVALAHLEPATEIRLAQSDRVGVARTIVARGEALLEGRRNQPAIELLEPAVRDYADLVPADIVVRLRLAYSRALNQTSRNDEAILAAEAALEIAEHEGLLRLTAQLFVTKAAALGGINRLREALALLQGAEDLCRQNGWDDLLAGVLTVTAVSAGEVAPRRAWFAVCEAAEIARRTGRRDRLWIAVGNVAYTGFVIGEWDAAIAQIDPTVSETDMDPGQRIWVLSNAIVLHANRGDDVVAMAAEMDQVVGQLDEVELRSAAGDAHANLALAHGDLDSAATLWRETAKTEPQFAPWGHYQASRAALWQGNLDELVDDIVAVEQSGLHGPVNDARLLTMRAGVAALKGLSADAAALYERALDAWRALDLVWDEALTGLDMVTVLDPALPEVRSVAEATSSTFARLDARPFMAKLDAALAREPGPIRSDSDRSAAAVLQPS